MEKHVREDFQIFFYQIDLICQKSTQCSVSVKTNIKYNH
jgi:hypothetical protein